MLLGGIRYLLPVIKAAHEQGYYVITADYLPDNIAHKYSDEYVNVNIVNREAVLREAMRRKIDGIMSFGVDPGVVSSAFVQQELGLPQFGPFESVVILQNKDRFRQFLKNHGFNVPKIYCFSNLEEALSYKDRYDYPVIVKPTDCAGSKGVTRVDNSAQLLPAIQRAGTFSLSGRIIVEDFIEKVGFSSDADCFSLDGVLTFADFNSQHFDSEAPNPYVPAAYSWPSSFTPSQIASLKSDIQRLITILGMKTNIYNIETRIGVDGKAYIMELTPRGGGNRLSEMVRYATDVDLITAMTRYIVGDDVPSINPKPLSGNWAEFIIHSNQSGYYQGLNICNEFKPYLVDEDIWISKGEKVNRFMGASDSIGTLIMNFPDPDTMNEAINNTNSWLKVETY